MTWRILKADGSNHVCPQNYDKVKVSLSNSDVFRWFNSSRVGDLLETVYDCTAGRATLQVPISGPVGFATSRTPYYSITMAITEPTGEVTLQATKSQLVDLTGGPASASFDIYPEAGLLITRWSLGGNMSNTSLSCAAAGVAKVRVTHKRVELLDGSPGDMKETVDTHDCGGPADEDWIYEYVDCLGCVGGGESSALEYGFYRTRLEALSPSGVVVGTRDYDPTSSSARVRENTWSGVGNGGGNVARSSVFPTQSHSIIIDNR